MEVIHKIQEGSTDSKAETIETRPIDAQMSIAVSQEGFVDSYTLRIGYKLGYGIGLQPHPTQSPA